MSIIINVICGVISCVIEVECAVSSAALAVCEVEVDCGCVIIDD